MSPPNPSVAPAGIAIDAMGGDRAPAEVVRGTVLAAERMPAHPLFLVGKEEVVQAQLADLGAHPGNIQIVGARNVIDMGDSPVEALRKKRGSSIEEAVRLIESGKAAAVVSAGNTGACVAAATILLGLLPLVKRAGIAVTFYAGNRPMVLIDAGANVTSKAEHLIQYGIMASLYAREILGVENPRVGLLNIGEENKKGNRLVKEAHPQFEETRLNFAGNIEGGELFRDASDVVVCDGFTGNIVLKVSEGLAERLVDLFETLLEQTAGVALDPRRDALPAVSPAHVRVPQAGLGRVEAVPSARYASVGKPTASGTLAEDVQGLLRRSLSSLREKLDYAEFGGAPLLGANGVVIIAHGRSDAKAICNAILMAKRMAEVNINLHITEEIRAFTEQKVS